MSGPCTARVRVMSWAFPQVDVPDPMHPSSQSLIKWPGFTHRVRARCRRKLQPRVSIINLTDSLWHLGLRHPSRPGPWAFRLAAPALHPLAIVSNECGEIVPKPVHIPRISTVRERGSSTAGRRRCRNGASSRMLSCKHSMETRPPLELVARGAKSIPCFRCSASPLTKTCATC
jgi:hypothetical protein